MDDPARLDAIFAALADPVRRGMVARLAGGEMGATELAAPLVISQPAVSRHIKVLERAGLILRRVDGTRRPCRLAPDALAGIEAWADTMRRTMAANYDRLDGVLSEMEEKENDQTDP